MAEEKKEIQATETKVAEEKKAPQGKKFSRGKKNFTRAPRKEIVKEFDERVVAINRVTKVVKGGKRMKFSALVVIGNGKGKFGFATGKSVEVQMQLKRVSIKQKEI